MAMPSALSTSFWRNIDVSACLSVLGPSLRRRRLGRCSLSRPPVAELRARSHMVQYGGLLLIFWGVVQGGL